MSVWKIIDTGIAYSKICYNYLSNKKVLSIYPIIKYIINILLSCKKYSVYTFLRIKNTIYIITLEHGYILFYIYAKFYNKIIFLFL